jgi:hypothetical protein
VSNSSVEMANERFAACPLKDIGKKAAKRRTLLNVFLKRCVIL